MLTSRRRRHFDDCRRKIFFTGVALSFFTLLVHAQTDPGPRAGAAGAGGMLPGLGNKEQQTFTQGQGQFNEVQSVTGSISGTEPGLGPRFNLNSCAGCHFQPAVGGSSPANNPQVAMASLNRVTGQNNTVPFFVLPNGPVREARFKFVDAGTHLIRDGGVHDVFTITGRTDAPGCTISQPNFDAANTDNNLIFRIPTPTFGAGLIEAITDTAILVNKGLNASAKTGFGISGHENREGNAGTVTRFGWKAQNKSLVIFSGEAYNVEQGVTNELFQQERDETPGCLFNGTPEDHVSFAPGPIKDLIPDVNGFANFMRFLAAPTPVASFTGATAASITHGQSLFTTFAADGGTGLGCVLCHTQKLTTGTSPVPALTNKDAFLYSDLLVHHMGTDLADDILQGNAQADEFRTAPLWGLGQRIFFLHDGRTSSLIDAITAHKSNGSEASTSVDRFNALGTTDKQDLLNFLRSL